MRKKLTLLFEFAFRRCLGLLFAKARAVGHEAWGMRRVAFGTGHGARGMRWGVHSEWHTNKQIAYSQNISVSSLIFSASWHLIKGNIKIRIQIKFICYFHVVSFYII